MPTIALEGSILPPKRHKGIFIPELEEAKKELVILRSKVKVLEQKYRKHHP